MKTIVLLMVLVISTNGNLYAQRSLKKHTLEPEKLKNFRQSYVIDLKKENYLRLDIYDEPGTRFTANVDSLVNVMAETIANIEDSLPSEFASRTITVSTYDTLARTASWISYPSAERKMMFIAGKKGELKTTQDTLIMNVYQDAVPGKPGPPFLRISFYLNNLHQLGEFNKQQFNRQIQLLEPDNKTRWSSSKEGDLYLKTDPAIRVLKAAPASNSLVGFRLDLSVSAQNYKDRFVPSINMGIGILKTYAKVQHEYWLGNEYNFSFVKQPNNSARALVNSFVTFSFKTFRLPADRQRPFYFLPNVKLGYLYNRKDLMYDDHTFKIGLGQFGLGNQKLRVEPTFYFHDALKGFTPSIRITQSL